MLRPRGRRGNRIQRRRRMEENASGRDRQDREEGNSRALTACPPPTIIQVERRTVIAHMEAWLRNGAGNRKAKLWKRQTEAAWNRLRKKVSRQKLQSRRSQMEMKRVRRWRMEREVTVVRRRKMVRRMDKRALLVWRRKMMRRIGKRPQLVWRRKRKRTMDRRGQMMMERGMKLVARTVVEGRMTMETGRMVKMRMGRRKKKMMKRRRMVQRSVPMTWRIGPVQGPFRRRSARPPGEVHRA